MNAIVCEDVWKVYMDPLSAATDRDILVALRSGMTRHDVHERYKCHVAVAGVSFSVPAGETFCVMGLSGSGKSTLIRHINRLIEPSSGVIRINGEDIGTKSDASLRQLRAGTVSMVFQDVALWPHLTVRQNISYGLEIQGVERSRRDKVADEMLEIIQLSGWGNRFSHELSGGMKQRVGLARALATDPAILLLDEPFSALDPLIREELQDQFEHIIRRAGKTAVFITHDLNEAIRLGDKIAIMKDGEFVQLGSAEEILLQPKTDYVKRFVKAVPRLTIVKAASIMDPLQSLAGHERLPRVKGKQALSELLSIAARHRDLEGIVVTDDHGKPTGFVTLQKLLSSLASLEDKK